MNNKGFTLVELIVTIMLLSLIMSIGAYSIINIINNSKERNYESLISNIKTAVEAYAIECKYAKSEVITCSNPVTLGKLVQYGFLSGNEKNSDTNYTLVNPKDNNSIADCSISYAYNQGKITVNAVNPSGSCPATYEVMYDR